MVASIGVGTLMDAATVHFVPFLHIVDIGAQSKPLIEVVLHRHGEIKPCTSIVSQIVGIPFGIVVEIVVVTCKHAYAPLCVGCYRHNRQGKGEKYSF